MKQPESTPKVCCAKLSDGTPCGFTLIQGLNFCPKCGTRSPAQEGQQTQGPGEDDVQQTDDHSTAAAATVSPSDPNQRTISTEVLSASGGCDEGWF